jgi:hypothetical protein
LSGRSMDWRTRVAGQITSFANELTSARALHLGDDQR